MRFPLGTSTAAAIGSFVQYKVKSNYLFARCDAAEIDRQNQHQNKASQAGISTGSTPQSYLNYTPSSVWNENWDHCQHPANEDNSTAVRQIILIRHGQYHHVRGGDHLHTLTDLGHIQAKETGKRLSLLLEARKIFPIQRVYYSTMIRATETWQDIQSVLPSSVLPVDHQIRPCTMIREGAVCKPVPSATQWKVSEIDFIRDQPRVEAAFLKYIHRADNDEKENSSTVFVCHGNVIRYFVMRALQLPPEAWLRTAAYNASITILEIYPSGRVSLKCFGDVGHLSPELITYN